MRHGLMDRLIAAGTITSAVVEAAFRTVPPHTFLPAVTPLEVAYNADDAAVTKRYEREVGRRSSRRLANHRQGVNTKEDQHAGQPPPL
jgi:protein-L-isoaspartate O-methyltransferase